MLLVGLGYFFVDEMDVATSAFKSTRAVVLMIAAVAGWIIVRMLLFRFVRWPAVRLVPLLVGATAVLAVVVVPAYRTHTVVERLAADPVAIPDARADGDSAAAADDSRAVPSPPELVRTDAFRGIDHRARGTVSVYRRGDGSYVVGLENFDIQPGPDYDVYVVPGAERTTREHGTRIDDLRGNAGTQYYNIPVGLDLGSDPWTVLIWCQTFGVPVANATPS
jgi:hypothetical protein